MGDLPQDLVGCSTAIPAALEEMMNSHNNIIQISTYCKTAFQQVLPLSYSFSCRCCSFFISFLSLSSEKYIVFCYLFRKILNPIISYHQTGDATPELVTQTKQYANDALLNVAYHVHQLSVHLTNYLQVQATELEKIDQKIRICSDVCTRLDSSLQMALYYRIYHTVLFILCTNYVIYPAFQSSTRSIWCACDANHGGCARV